MASMPTNGSNKPNPNPARQAQQNQHRAPRNNTNHGDTRATQAATAKRGGAQSMNHLLSFTLPPRARPPAPVSRRSRRAGAGVPFNKERYINAQYRFLVKPTGDYTAYFADSDIYLHWPDILQVLIPTTSALSGASAAALPQQDQPLPGTHEGAACPICLSPPTAPRMTKCGHVFCYPCILHYLTLADGNAAGGSTGGNAPSHKWRRCPICWDAVYARDLKAVKWWDPRAVAQQHQAEVHEEQQRLEALRSSRQPQDSATSGGGAVGDAAVASTSAAAHAATGSRQEVLALRLIERPHLTTLALPQSSTWPTSNLDHPLIPLHSAPWHFQPDVMGFAKFMLASPDLLIESLTGDLVHLENELETLKGFGADEVSLEFVRLAERKVKEQIVKVQTELDTAFVRSTIGQIKNDLKDHEAVESGRISKLDEQLSRRQRKKLERSHTADDGPSAEAEGAAGAGNAVAVEPAASGSQANTSGSQANTSGSQANTDDNDRGDGAPETAEGAEEFLAIRSQAYGGSYQNASPAPAPNAANTAAVSAESDGQSSTKGDQRTSARPHHHQRKNVNPPAPSSSSYLFFQAASGQNIFLHPLDIKIVLSHFGSYAALPRDLSVKVQGADEGSMNDELRRRCRYLSHIPMATDVVFVEIDWENMDLVSKATLRPYEQALRQRRTKRRDKQRREDRAKTKAEEAESGSRFGGGSSSGGAGGASAQRHRIDAAGFGSEANFPSDGLSRSYGSSSFASGHEDGVSAAGLSTSPHVGTSPSFREAALWGAERDFPIHPGASQIEDFPDSLGASARPPRSDRSPHSGATAGASAISGGGGGGAKKTVWGTPAARNAFDRALRGGHDESGLWDDDIEDAWHELEEDFILGSTSSGRRPNGAVKEGRGLNRQAASSKKASVAGPGTVSGSSTPRGVWAGGRPGTGNGDAAPSDTASGAQTPASAGGGSSSTSSRKKNNKKKLVLTSGGGRGTW
ncbi:uncharacterized protein PSFLO_02919 [Pseudozyma flocculosa]|uniref:RING-type domain-containing protein n=1 Tax=Pseudozyma flocculosa TaxID=84751 RepID=A0A5C3F044_9BASI|nr:uncharacterized protein PSFLO_02919 [Pseudozyma flocculosa]